MSCTCPAGAMNQPDCPLHGTFAVERARLLRKARRCYVTVNGCDDTFAVRVTKPEAENLLNRAGLQLYCWLDDDGDLRIDTRTNFERDAMGRPIEG